MSSSSLRKNYAQSSRVETLEEPIPLRIIYSTAAAKGRRVWPYTLGAVLLLAVSVIIPVVLNTQIAQRAYDIRDQQVILNELEAESAALEQDLLEISSTQSLQEKAEELGLVPAGVPGVVSLQDQSVSGGVAASEE